MGKLTVDGLTKVFDEGESEIVAVDDLDLEIRDGEFLVLVGPSGCGKSTTLRTIAGLETLSEGDIRINENTVAGRKPKDRNIAMVFQNYALYPHMTARENMSFGLKMTTELERDEIDRRVDQAAEMMGIEELMRKKPGELSGGQQQRVALGRAIVREPEVFLMDEPLSNLDAKLRTTMRTELQNLQSELDVTTIYVTHDQTEAMTMGDRIAILDGGELQQVGTPLECYHQPANRFVAGFIGSPSMNFLDVRASEADGETVLEHEAFSYPLSDDTAERVDSSGAYTLGIRPEGIDVVESEGPHTVSVSVNVVEPLGDVSYAYVDLEGETLTVSVGATNRLDAGDEILLDLPEERLHLFDGDSGDAVASPDVDLADDASVVTEQTQQRSSS
jgi:multiple sugar transport system ATP-binding protein